MSVTTWQNLGTAALSFARALMLLIVTGLAGCATLTASTPDRISPVSTSIPAATTTSYHAAGLDFAYSHGAVVAAAGFDSTRAMVGNLPCSACHAVISPSQPSPNVRAPSCFACHAGGPDGSPRHPDGWFDLGSANFHGAVVKAAGNDYTRALAGNLPCSACHAGACLGQPSPSSRAPSCFSCHSGGPDGSANHPDGWLDQDSDNFHGAASVAAGYAKNFSGYLACSTCHAGDDANDRSPNHGAPNCYTCHEGGPDGSAHHPTGWNDATSSVFHGTVVKAAGDYTKAKSGTLACNACHAGGSPDLASPNRNAPNCYACHDGGPDGSVEHSTGWNDMTSPGFHGAIVKAAGGYAKAKAGVLACNACHAGTSATPTSPNSRAPSCDSCHEGGPDGSPGHPTGWSDITAGGFHGLAVASASFDFTRALSGTLTCATCHAGRAVDQVSPVAAAPNCFSCHEGGPSGSPHGPGWAIPRNAAFHGTFLANNGGYQNALAGGQHCNVCHNTAQNAASPWANAPNCYTCHQDGPSGSPGHSADWYTPDAKGIPPHGYAARADLASCARCHNTVARGMPNPAPKVALDCWSCHNGPGG